MAKSTDESPDVSPDPNQKNQAVESEHLSSEKRAIEVSSSVAVTSSAKSPEDIPFEDIPEATPSEDALPKDILAEDIPFEDIPEATPSEDALPKDILAKDIPAKDIPAEAIPAEAIPAEPIPAEDVPPEDIPPEDTHEFLTLGGLDPAAISLQIGGDNDAEIAGAIFDNLDEDKLLQQVAGVFLLWWHWAYFEITVTSPTLPSYNPPKLIHPELIQGTEDREFVYDICDGGYKFSTSKGEEMYSVGMSMCKMYYTIEKIIFILINRLKDGGVSTDTEVQVTFDGHLLGQRKAFESIINLNYNVVVTNFDPGVWGERYLEIVKRLADKGYGYPSEAPREIYKTMKKTSGPAKR